MLSTGGAGSFAPLTPTPDPQIPPWVCGVDGCVVGQFLSGRVKVESVEGAPDPAI